MSSGNLKAIFKLLFEDLEGFNLFPLKFHMLDDIFEDMLQLCDLVFLDSSSSQQLSMQSRHLLECHL